MGTFHDSMLRWLIDHWAPEATAGNSKALSAEDPLSPSRKDANNTYGRVLATGRVRAEWRHRVYVCVSRLRLDALAHTVTSGGETRLGLDVAVTGCCVDVFGAVTAS